MRNLSEPDLDSRGPSAPAEGLAGVRGFLIPRLWPWPHLPPAGCPASSANLGAGPENRGAGKV